ncbi:MAG: DUF3347 domain-containing protein [Balneolaceae bacterium]|nr:DUF3347 domain-containing protein [Balneolaceae bacterium]
MLAKGVVSSPLDGGQPQLQIPASAVLWTGERSLVYVQRPNTEQPAFQAREVVLGHRVGDSYVVLEGLQEGEDVVIHGNFMIDSAAQLADKRSMMNQAPGQNGGRMPGEHNHDSGENMDTGHEHTTQSSAQTESTEDVSGEFRSQLNSLIKSYLEISHSLADDNFKDASSALSTFEKKLKAVDMSLIQQQDRRQFWMERQQQIKDLASQMSNAESIAVYRSQFASLSDQLAETVNRFGSQQTLYLQYCQMARDSKGANWLSAQKEIINPYMGQQMPNCGVKKEVFDS